MSSLENRIRLALSTSFVLQVCEYKLTTKNSNSSNSASLMSSSVTIEDNFLNNGVILSMDVHVSKKRFLFFLDSDDIVSQPLNAWKTEMPNIYLALSF